MSFFQMMRLLSGLTMLVGGAVGAQANNDKPNWVDTITVGRLATGGCEWEKAAPRMRPGNPGTTTRPGPLNEKTCTVLASNYTTGTGQERPLVVGFVYVQDHSYPPGKNVVLNFADTFTVARQPDGRCDWRNTPFRPGIPGSSSYVGEVRTKDCWGVVYNVNFPPQDAIATRTSVSIVLGSDVWEGPDTLSGRGRQARDIANAASAMAPRGARLEQMSITDDSLAEVVVVNPGSRTERYWYSFNRVGSRWVASGKPRPF